METDTKQNRTCVVSRTKHNKADMIRIVSFRGEPLHIDLTGKQPGRGCYIAPEKHVLDKLFQQQGAQLARSLKKKITLEELEYLKNELPLAIEEKQFRPRHTKSITLKITKEEYNKSINK
ncbi:MAG: YlxR family protein [Candidatus Dojkabacteria bacterium]